MKKNLMSRSSDTVFLKEPDYLVEYDRRLNMVGSRMMIDVTYYTVPKSSSMRVGGGQFFIIEKGPLKNLLSEIFFLMQNLIFSDST
jgi:hypothetical protein